MSIVVGVPIIECISALACAQWMLRRCLHSGVMDSEGWPMACVEDFRPVPRMCQMILAVYEPDLNNPQWSPEGGYQLDPSYLIRKTTYKDTEKKAPPYIIYLDHKEKDIVMALRGLNLKKESDYQVLLDNHLGQTTFEGGYAHHGLLAAAKWIFEKEGDTLRDLVLKHPSYTLSFTGHSLGSGVAAMLTVLAVTNGEKVGNIPRKQVRCYAIAPARCMSLNLAVLYADIIKSVVLQDDFLPRTATPLEDIFKSIFCLPCHLFMRCMRDTFVPEKKLLKDTRRLYAPGRLYHVVDRGFCGCGLYPAFVRTAIPVQGRFEHVVLSCNATSDHSLVWIEKECRRALELMIEDENALEIPVVQKMERLNTTKDVQAEEHKAALSQAFSLKIPHAFPPPQEGSGTDKPDDKFGPDAQAGAGTVNEKAKEETSSHT